MQKNEIIYFLFSIANNLNTFEIKFVRQTILIDMIIQLVRLEFKREEKVQINQMK